MPAFFNIDVLSELVNIGTLLAFTIVCAGVWVLRVRHPNMERPFKTPFVPLVPILGILSALYLMTRLALITWEVMIVWLLIGLVIYFGYSRKHSKVQTDAGAAGWYRATESHICTANKNGLLRGRPFYFRCRTLRGYAVVFAQNSSKARISSPAICCAVACSITKRCIR